MLSLAGKTLDGKYLVRECLGTGGMGAVFRAEHVGIGRSVALKVMRPELVASGNSAERFQREARAAGTLRHPRIVNVTDFGVCEVDDARVAYLVMEYLSGQTLADVLEERKTLPLRIAADVVMQIAEALGAAHAAGIVHRDLKPANIWLTADARGGFQVTLLDFGIAKLRDDVLTESSTMIPIADDIDADEATLARTTTADKPTLQFAGTNAATEPLTRVGDLVGTPAYMSPEQCTGSAIDPRSDIYSLGVLTYRLLSGKLPFEGSIPHLLRQHANAEPPPFDGGRVEPVVRRALAKKRDDRFPSAIAFAASLQAHALDASESVRRAIALFVGRLPELMPFALWMTLPGFVATLLCLLTWKVPFLWPVFAMLAFLTSGTAAMAWIAAIADDLQHRPFAEISARDVVRRIGFLQPMRLYFQSMKHSKGSSIHTMLLFLSLFDKRADEARVARMAAVLPKRAFQTMAALQIIAVVLLPLIVPMAGYGVAKLFKLANVEAIVMGCWGLAFSITLGLQTLVALVDVMLYELALQMTD